MPKDRQRPKPRGLLGGLMARAKDLLSRKDKDVPKRTVEPPVTVEIPEKPRERTVTPPAVRNKRRMMAKRKARARMRRKMARASQQRNRR